MNILHKTQFHLVGAALVVFVALVAPAAHGWSLFDQYEPEVVVSDPYLELRTGPGRGYPVFYVAGQGDRITLLKRRTDWFKVAVTNPREKQGWVHREALSHTLDLDGSMVEVGALGLDDFSGRRWEMGFSGGDFNGASALSGYLGYALTPNITVQIEGGQILGDYSDGVMASANILMFPFPKWRLSPYFTIGSGIITTKPHSTVVVAEDREDEIVNAGVGANLYLSDRFMLRMEYKRLTVLTSRDDNEEIDQWKAGFSVFF